MEERELEKDMTPILIKDLGMRFPTEKSSRKYRYGLYKCGYCGKEFEVITRSIKAGTTKSCGCILNKNKITHGLTQHRLYHIWNKMVDRCCNINNKNYKDYGDRGITVCAEWRESPLKFIEDMFPSFEEGLTLDRVDNDKGYSKENCRWATKTEQRINRRIFKNNTSGFVGVYYHSRDLVFIAYLNINKNTKYLGEYPTAVEAAIARNNYIIENGLPHKLNIIPEEEI